MTPGADVGFTWVHILGAFGGMGLFIGGVVLLYRFKEWRRESRRERPPQSEKILRPAGWSSMQEFDEVFERLMFAFLWGVAGGAMVGVMLGGFVPIVQVVVLGQATWGQVARVPQFYLGAILWVGGLLWAVFWFVRFSELLDEVRHWRFGMRGEQAVAEKLSDRELAAAGYVVFHDLVRESGKKRWNVDHVVVGPGGVFVLETKARSKRKATRKQDEKDVIYDGKSLQFPWCVDWEAVPEVQRNADWVRELIKNVAPDGILVQPVIVVPGWFVVSKGNYPVKAMPANYLVGYLTREKPVYSAKELRGVVDKLGDRCRDLEF
jgi:hypothetical protein